MCVLENTFTRNYNPIREEQGETTIDTQINTKEQSLTQREPITQKALGLGIRMPNFYKQLNKITDRDLTYAQIVGYADHGE